MIVNYTEAEKKKQDALESKYEKLFAKAEAEIDRTQPQAPPPDLNSFYKGLDPLKNKAAWKKANEKANKAYDKWEKSGGDAYIAAKDHYAALMSELHDKRRALFAECERRQFAELNNDIDRITADFKQQVEDLILEIYRQEKAHDEQIAQKGGGERSSIYIVATSKTSWKLYAPEIIATIKRSLHLHYDFVEDDETLTREYNEYLEKTVYKSPLVATPKQSEKYTGVSDSIEIAAAPGVAPKEPPGLLQSLDGRRVKKVDYPLDKPNNNIWNGLLEHDASGQYSFSAAFDVTKSKDKDKGKEALILYSLSFEDIDENVKITKKLLPYDKRVYIAVAALYNAGNSVISVGQIYNAMGYDGKPGKGEREKIDSSMLKLGKAWIHIDNKLETPLYKYDAFEYDGALLQIEIMRAKINGQTVESAYHIFREPTLVEFARKRKQITTLERKLLQTPLSKTDQNLLIEDYLIDHIAAVKSGRRNPKVLYSTIYSNAGITTKLQRSRAPEKIRKLLNYWKECGHISGFTEEKDGITIKI